MTTRWKGKEEGEMEEDVVYISYGFCFVRFILIFKKIMIYL